MPSFITLPIPDSWYAVTFSDDLQPGVALARTLAAQKIVLFRMRGVARALDAYCPRPGAQHPIGRAGPSGGSRRSLRDRTENPPWL